MVEYLFEPIDGLFKLALTLILLAVIILLSRYRKLDIEEELIVATVRGFMQLMFLALILTFIFESHLVLVLVVYGVMILMAGYTSSKRAKKLKAPLELTTTSILVGAGITLIIMILTGIIPLRMEFLIPLGGMVIGNSMINCSLALDRLGSDIQSNRNKIEAALSLGATSEQASLPQVRAAVRASLIPTIDNLKTLGIILIPGTMTGLLIAGADPIWAASYQLIIFFMILCAGSITIITATYLAQQKLFSKKHQLIDIN
ncbi:MAG: iron export ABC transporter permease subunit FetB [Thermoplasmata archaeon]|nr:MAG: iron export ABC transporter permease subunit FetB [Thermoplasmata archaeon]